MVLYLASSSPRRRMLLEQIGLQFTVLQQEVDEALTYGEPPYRQVEILAERKAKAAAKNVPQGLIIGADTIVVCRGQVLGKPVDADDAERMLNLLQGIEHDVYTGVAVIEKPSKKALVAYEQTGVRFRTLSEHDIKSYIATGEPLGKAGAYAAQGLGAIFITGINGCFSNVVGLPIACLAGMLKVFGVDVLGLGSCNHF